MNRAAKGAARYRLDSGEEVSNEEIQKGYEVEPGKFVILTDEDLEGPKLRAIARD